MVEGKQMALPNGAFRRLFRARSQKNARINLLETIARASRGGAGSVSQSDENGVVRMKIVVKKKDLAQVLEAMGCGSELAFGTAAVPSVSVEQRLNLLRRKHLLRAKLAKTTWSPALQSIPEEMDSDIFKLF